MAKVLVAGASGFLGGEICSRLRAQGHEVRGLVRASSDPARTQALAAKGVSLAVGDLTDRASLDAACSGVEAVVSSATGIVRRQAGDDFKRVDHDGQLSLVAVAERAGVKHFTYVSISRNVGADDPLTRAKRAVEAAVRTSGMHYTILRPTMFMDYWLSPLLGFDHVNAAARIYGDGSSKLSWIALADVAEFVARSIDSPAARDAVIELGGPAALSPLEVVRVFEQRQARPFTLEFVPVSALRAQYEAADREAPERTFAALMLSYAAGDEITMNETLASIPVALTSVQDYAARVGTPATVGS